MRSEYDHEIVRRISRNSLEQFGHRDLVYIGLYH